MIYLFTLALFCVGLYAVLVKKNLIKIIIGLSIMKCALNLFFILIGYRSQGRFPILSRQALDVSNPALNAGQPLVDPLVQALVLIAIVIGLAATALLVAVAMRLYEKMGTFDITKIRKLNG